MLTPHSHSSSIMYKSLLFIQAITSASCMHSYQRKKVGKTVTTNCFTTNSVMVPNNLQQPKLIFSTYLYIGFTVAPSHTTCHSTGNVWLVKQRKDSDRWALSPYLFTIVIEFLSRTLHNFHPRCKGLTLNTLRCVMICSYLLPVISC